MRLKFEWELKQRLASQLDVRSLMITVCHPRDDLEQLFIVSLLEEADIPYFIVGQNFGSLYPGIQIPWYNQRSIRVPSSYLDFACEVVEGFRAAYVGPSENLAYGSKLRMGLEVLFCGWIVPGGKKRTNEDKPGSP